MRIAIYTETDRRDAGQMTKETEGLLLLIVAVIGVVIALNRLSGGK